LKNPGSADRGQLFDLSSDPHEDHNLAAEHPARVQKMVALLKSQVEKGRSTPGPGLKNDKPEKNRQPQ
jgi:hypothetical protein